MLMIFCRQIIALPQQHVGYHLVSRDVAAIYLHVEAFSNLYIVRTEEASISRNEGVSRSITLLGFSVMWTAAMSKPRVS
jgi:hypothetical protein